MQLTYFNLNGLTNTGTGDNLVYPKTIGGKSYYPIIPIFDKKYNLETDQKLHIIENVDVESCVSEYNAAELIDFFMQVELNAKNVNAGVTDAIDRLLHLENVPTLDRIRLFNKYSLYEDVDELDQFIATFSGEYIANSRLRHQIPLLPETAVFSDYLKRISFLRSAVKRHDKGCIYVLYTPRAHTAPLY